MASASASLGLCCGPCANSQHSARLNQLALKAYLANFDFTGIRLDAAFRRLCEKLYLKAETQQVDRILVEFSARYFANNPSTLYGSADIVHIVTYTLLLLNTDLHVVESNTRMSRNQFVRNAMSGIQASSTPTPNDATPAPSPNPAEEAKDETIGRASMDRVRDAFSPRSRSKRSNSVASQRSQKEMLLVSASHLGGFSPAGSQANTPAASPVKSRKTAFANEHPPIMSRAWQAEMEVMLKVRLSAAFAVDSERNVRAGHVRRHSRSTGLPTSCRRVVAQSARFQRQRQPALSEPFLSLLNLGRITTEQPSQSDLGRHRWRFIGPIEADKHPWYWSLSFAYA